MSKRKLRFIDLFAGLGGFHKTLHKRGHEIVFDRKFYPVLIEIYFKNRGINVYLDKGIAN